MSRPVYKLVGDMLKHAVMRLRPDDQLLLHSDQGWHYQMKQYQRTLKQHNITQSISCKGNCLDNAVIENFFGFLKSELLYLQEFDSMEHFEKELADYIHYYNNKRMKVKLKDLSPVEYRSKPSFGGVNKVYCSWTQGSPFVPVSLFGLTYLDILGGHPFSL